VELILENGVGAAKVEPQRTAVLAVHWQVDAVKADGAFGPIFARTVEEAGVIPRTARVLAAARAARSPVIYVNVCFWPGHTDLVRNNALFNTVWEKKGFVRGTRGVEVIPELAPQPGDYVIEHSRISAFHGNDILMILRARGIETVAITGVATNVAIDHTVRDAAQLGFNTVLLEDCCCSSSPAYQEAALMSLRVIATKIVDASRFRAALGGASGGTV
jgi:nicotinamidase-related amidase